MDEGDVVKKGQLLLQIDATNPRAAARSSPSTSAIGPKSVTPRSRWHASTRPACRPMVAAWNASRPCCPSASRY